MKQRRDEGFVRSELDDSHFVVAVIVASCWVSFSAGTYKYTLACRSFPCVSWLGWTRVRLWRGGARCS